MFNMLAQFMTTVYTGGVKPVARTAFIRKSDKSECISWLRKKDQVPGDNSYKIIFSNTSEAFESMD